MLFQYLYAIHPFLTCTTQIAIVVLYAVHDKHLLTPVSLVQLINECQQSNSGLVSMYICT